MGRKKKKQLKPWCWYPSVWDEAGVGSWVGEGSGPARPGPVGCLSRRVPSCPIRRLAPRSPGTGFFSSLHPCYGLVPCLVVFHFCAP